jgi:antitoxin MazE
MVVPDELTGCRTAPYKSNHRIDDQAGSWYAPTPMIYEWSPYIMEPEMKVAKWGNSLAVRLPRELVDALDLKEGDNIELLSRDTRSMVVEKTRDTDREAFFDWLTTLRGRLPADFKFDRDEANSRD